MGRLIGWLMGAMIAVAVVPAHGETPPQPKAVLSDLNVTAADRAIGSPDAPVTVVEYASLTCPHCAAFAMTMLPAIRKEFVESGIVRLVYRDFPLDRLALVTAVIARCAGPDRYFALIEDLYAEQHRWVRDSDPLTAVARIAAKHGVAPGQARQCLADSQKEEAVLLQRMEAERTFGVTSTPTIFIGGERYGPMTLEQFRAIVARHRKP